MRKWYKEFREEIQMAAKSSICCSNKLVTKEWQMKNHQTGRNLKVQPHHALTWLWRNRYSHMLMLRVEMGRAALESNLAGPSKSVHPVIPHFY